MADEVEEEKAAEGEEEKTEVQGKKPLIKWVAIGVLGLAVLAGVGFFFMKGGSADQEMTAEELAVEEEELEDFDLEDEKEMALYDLDPFIVNLADVGTIRYLKVTIKLHLAKEEFREAVERFLPQLRDSLLILLSSKDYEGIRSVDGKMELRDEIIGRANAVLKRRAVRTAYFTEFVVQ